ncbi:MAG: hypothetical protein N3C60_06095 [Calditerrivibrio sp.]|nr:hypothetical protein [Calditerrivibrio sp.]
MKRSLVIGLVLALSSFVTAALNVDTNIQNISAKPSQNVDVAYGVDTGQLNYGLATKHSSGNRVFATTNNTTSIYYKENDTYKGQSLGATNTLGEITEGAADISGWSKL